MSKVREIIENAPTRTVWCDCDDCTIAYNEDKCEECKDEYGRQYRFRAVMTVEHIALMEDVIEADVEYDEAEDAHVENPYDEERKVRFIAAVERRENSKRTLLHYREQNGLNG